MEVIIWFCNGIVLFAIIVGIAVFAVVWLYVIWIAFTQGDDILARLGRRVLEVLKNEQS